MRLLLCIVSAIAVTSAAPSTVAQQVGWRSGYGEAVTIAEKEEVPVLLHFHAWYCGPCQRMDREVFSDFVVQNALRTEIAAVQLDVTHEPELASQFKATTVPRDVVVFPDGAVETLNIGYMNKRDYVAMLQDVARRGKTKRAARREDAVPNPIDPSISPDKPGLIVESQKPVIAPKVQIVDGVESGASIIGLEGYCPVQLHDHRKWTPGLKSISTDYREIRYLFSSESAREIFQQDPAQYAPQDLGCDPVLLTSSSKAVTGSIRYGAFFDQRLYLFRTPENRDEFKLNPLKYVRIRSALRVNQIEGTRFQ